MQLSLKKNAHFLFFSIAKCEVSLENLEIDVASRARLVASLPCACIMAAAFGFANADVMHGSDDR